MLRAGYARLPPRAHDISFGNRREPNARFSRCAIFANDVGIRFEAQTRTVRTPHSSRCATRWALPLSSELTLVDPDDVSTDWRLIRRKLRSTDIDLYHQVSKRPRLLKRRTIGKQRRGTAAHQKQNFLSRTEFSIFDTLNQARERFAAIYRVE